MERQTMFVVKMLTLKLVQRFNAIPIKISAIFHVGLDKIILKLVRKGKRTRKAKTILREKNKVGGISLSNFKTYYLATVTQTVQYWWKNRHTDQWKKIRNPETDPHKYRPLIFDKGVNPVSETGNNFFNKWYWTYLIVTGKKKKKKRNQSLSKLLTLYKK